MKLFKCTLSLLLIFSLSACVTRSMSDLEEQVNEILARPGSGIKPLPEIRPYDAYNYQSGKADKDSPFKLFYVLEKPDFEGALPNEGLTEEMKREINNRNREELEQFELDSLRMVGTLDNQDNNWAIVLDPNGVIHRVQAGNYMGLNTGKIISVSESQIEIREIVQDVATGRWEEREASLALIEE